MTFSLLFNLDSSEKNDHHQVHDEVVQFHDHDFQSATGLPNPNFENQECLPKNPGVNQGTYNKNSGEKPGVFYNSYELIWPSCFEENCNFC